MARQEGRHCSIGFVRARTAWLAGAAGAAIAVYRRMRRAPVAPAPVEDPRAAELRDRLEESRAVVDERDEFESAETPVDQVEADSSPEERRRAVHERGRAASEQMRGGPGSAE
jgi:hypothetical protein